MILVPLEGLTCVSGGSLNSFNLRMVIYHTLFTDLFYKIRNLEQQPVSYSNKRPYFRSRIPGENFTTVPVSLLRPDFTLTSL